MILSRKLLNKLRSVDCMLFISNTFTTEIGKKLSEHLATPWGWFFCYLKIIIDLGINMNTNILNIK